MAVSDSDSVADHNNQLFIKKSYNRLFATVLFLNHFVVLPLISGKTSVPNTVNSVVTKRGIGTTGLKKQCLVRLSTYVNDISIELKAVRQA